MSMISEIIEELIDNADLYTKELHDLMYRAADAIVMLSEKAREPKQDGEDYLRGYQDGWVAHETISKSELHIDKPRGYQAQSISDGRSRR